MHPSSSSASKNTTRRGYTNFFVAKFNISLLEEEHTEMPLNGPREGSVALSLSLSHRIEFAKTSPSSLDTRAPNAASELTISCEACMSIHICDSTCTYRPVPPTLPKNIFWTRTGETAFRNELPSQKHRMPRLTLENVGNSGGKIIKY